MEDVITAMSERGGWLYDRGGRSGEILDVSEGMVEVSDGVEVRWWSVTTVRDLVESGSVEYEPA